MKQINGNARFHSSKGGFLTLQDWAPPPPFELGKLAKRLIQLPCLSYFCKQRFSFACSILAYSIKKTNLQEERIMRKPWQLLILHLLISIWIAMSTSTYPGSRVPFSKYLRWNKPCSCPSFAANYQELDTKKTLWNPGYLIQDTHFMTFCKNIQPHEKHPIKTIMSFGPFL